jgi:hypothetical protein
MEYSSECSNKTRIAMLEAGRPRDLMNGFAEAKSFRTSSSSSCSSSGATVVFEIRQAPIMRGGRKRQTAVAKSRRGYWGLQDGKARVPVFNPWIDAMPESAGPARND